MSGLPTIVAAMKSRLNVVPTCRRYLTYARSTVTSRPRSPARSTSRLNRSFSISPRHTAASVSWKRSRTSATSRPARAVPVQPEVVDPHRIGAHRPDLVRALVDDLRPHVLEQGQDVGEREGLTVAVQLQPGGRVDGLVRPVEVDRETVIRFAGQQCLKSADVAHGGAGGVVVLVRRRQRVRVAVEEQHPSFLAEPLDERVGEIVGPRPQGGGEPRLDRRRVVVGRCAGLGVDHEVQAGDGRVGDQRRLLGVHAVEGAHQSVADAHADRLGEPAERQVDEAGEEAPEVVAADPQPQPLPVLQFEDRDGVAVQVVDPGLQEFVPRVVVQDVERAPAPRSPAAGRPRGPARPASSGARSGCRTATAWPRSSGTARGNATRRSAGRARRTA